MASLIPSVARPSVSGRPRCPVGIGFASSDLSSPAIFASAAAWPLGSGQSECLAQSATKDSKATWKPLVWPRSSCWFVSVGSRAPSRTRRPTRDGEEAGVRRPEIGAVGGPGSTCACRRAPPGARPCRGPRRSVETCGSKVTALVLAARAERLLRGEVLRLLGASRRGWGRPRSRRRAGAAQARTGALSPTPRGSKPTMSNVSRSGSPNCRAPRRA